MVPLSLRLQGVYSYIHEQFIDFQNLTSNGLFGIFGQVGSGKSSIIEAITVTLYGENDRLDNSSFWYNMMNLQSDRGHIVFEFEYEDILYKFEVKFRRNSKNFRDVKGERTAYKWEENTWLPISVDAEKILGLSYKYFKRTTIIPQGKFREFLELKPAERTQMIKDIFELYRFDLKDKINHKYSETEKEKLVLEGNIKSYENISEEKIKELETELHTEQLAFNRVNETLISHQKTLNAYQQLEQNWKKYQQYKSQLETLGAEEASYLEQQNNLNLYIDTRNTFKSLLDQEQHIVENLAKDEAKLTLLKNQIKVIIGNKTEHEKTFTEAKAAFDSIGDKKIQIEELNHAINIVRLKQEILSAKERLQKGETLISDKVNNKTILETELAKCQAALNALGTSKLDTSIIYQIEHWHLKNNTYKQQLAQIYLKKSKINTHLRLIEDKYNNSPLYSIATYANYIQKQIQIIDQQLVAIKADEQKLQVQNELQNYVLALKNGEPCPLCGALDHPNVTHHTSDVKVALQQIQQNIQQFDLQKDNLQKALIEFKNDTNEYQYLQTQITLLNEESQAISQNLASHKSAATFDELYLNDTTSFETEKQRYLKFEEDKRNINNRILELNQEIDKISNNLKRYEEELSKIQQEIVEKEAAKKVLYNQFKQIDGNYYVEQSMETIQLHQQQIAQFITLAEQIFSQAQHTLHQTEQQYNAYTGELQATQQFILEKQSQLQTIQQSLNNLLQSSTFQNVDEVKNIILQNIDINATQTALNNFFQELNNTKINYLQLEKELGNQAFDAQHLAELLAKNQELTSTKDTLLGKISSINTQLSALKNQYETYITLKAQYDKINNKLSHLSTLKKLFHGDKFIEYISGTFLNQLCEYANIRFHKLTKNHLSLQINDKMEFEIVDYLNGGKSRSVKTLSGGQAFQASLCLALALAESVQAKSKQDKHFFFIDEGFGTQDKNSINTIFETLVSISNENRIVGIISHVEELQENISRYILVEKDEEKGSTITQF
jgi:exonuclease SbcC